eukprot:700561-Amphidinium_carterae.2
MSRTQNTGQLVARELLRFCPEMSGTFAATPPLENTQCFHDPRFKCDHRGQEDTLSAGCVKGVFPPRVRKAPLHTASR